jgi:hypothetical protein
VLRHCLWCLAPICVNPPAEPEQTEAGGDGFDLAHHRFCGCESKDRVIVLLATAGQETTLGAQGWSPMFQVSPPSVLLCREMLFFCEDFQRPANDANRR